ncbi:MAG: tRNA-dihydrouridine synthase [Nitrospira sp.]|nr:tRNA-dihydrouridine synthase [Nitrospira sp.]MCP9461940.1 tRNA-dihydrouridine synthase [Nitrospira sp.]MCP9476090.1 tRNA-dihydrouridine synthase [Nitrospira sp.]
MNFWKTLPRPVIGLAPMDGVTDAGFRSIVARQGKPDVIFTEFTHVHDVCRGPEHLLDTLIYSEIERPIVAQLYGNDPDLFYRAAYAVCELGFDGLDINMGCPSKSVASSGSGAGLIRTPELARAILRAAKRGIDDWASGRTLEQAGFQPEKVAAFRRLNERRGGQAQVERRSIPLSVKTRIGYDAVAVEPWLEQLAAEHPAAISLHGRTLKQMYRGSADWSAIARAVEIVGGAGILLFGNGDIQSLHEAAVRVRETGVDGVLVGRAVLGAPWFFQEKERARTFAQGTNEAEVGWDKQEVPLSRRFAVLLDHARQFEAFCGPNRFYRMRKHLAWYCKGFPHAAALRARMVRLSSIDELESILDDYLNDRLLPAATEQVDDELEPVSRCG